MNLQPNESEALRRLKTILQNQENFVELRIFGSKAKNLSTADSDIDVMIIVRKYSPDLQSLIDDTIFDLNIQYDCLISAIIFSQEELDNGPMSESPLYKTALQEGIQL
ncbi:MAG: nucleotidyltransferase domain-containing protein [Desulfobacterales bacterium]